MCCRIWVKVSGPSTKDPPPKEYRTSPPVGTINVDKIRNSVVFPDPFGPRNPRIPARFASHDTEASAVPSPYRRVKLWIETTPSDIVRPSPALKKINHEQTRIVMN